MVLEKGETETMVGIFSDDKRAEIIWKKSQRNRLAQKFLDGVARVCNIQTFCLNSTIVFYLSRKKIF